MGLSPNRKAIMVILDGYGVSTSSNFNAVEKAKTPYLKKLFSREGFSALLDASGHAVGLPTGQMGNSEVGHLHLGAGRLCLQGFSLISEKLRSRSLESHPLFLEKIQKLIEKNGALHFLGLLSPGGVHSHEDHFLQIIETACRLGVKRIYFHAILDGRDVPPRSAKSSLEKMQKFQNFLESTYHAELQMASLIGRAYSMDRDQRWERIEKGYRLLTEGQAEYLASSAEEALSKAYDRGENDEFVSSTWCLPKSVEIDEADLILIGNFRADRAKQMSCALTQESFDPFKRVKCFKNLLTLTQYDPSLSKYAIFPQEILKNTLAEILSNAGKQQLHIGETEKFAHVTFFFNGNRYDPFDGEDRILIPSDRSVRTYDLHPQMEAQAITQAVQAAIEHRNYDFILMNYANPDMVGHTGNFESTLTALEHLDHCLQKIGQLAVDRQFELFITADHGNAEEMFHAELNQKNTAHTSNPVPLFYVGNFFSALQTHGSLIDVAPTVLECLGLPIPSEMSGKSLGLK